MKVYRIRPDVTQFQKLFPDDDSIWSTGMLTFDGTPKASIWCPPKVFVLKPKLKRGNFFGVAAGALVADPKACGELAFLLEVSTEMLPLPFEGQELKLINVIACVNVLDQDKTLRSPVGKPTKYVFKPNRFTESPLFKIPETDVCEILTIEGLKDPEDEFKFNVESRGLTGLTFEELWDSEKS